MRAMLCVVVLFAIVPDVAAQPYRVVELPMPPARFTARAIDLNDHGEVLGVAERDLVFWDASGVHTIGELNLSGPLLLDNRGVLTGERYVSGDFGPTELFEWRNGEVRRLDLLPNIDSERLVHQTPNGIRLIAGGGRYWAAVGDSLFDLTAFIGGASVSAINERGTIVGFLQTNPSVPAEEYLRYLDGRIVRLPTITPKWVLGNGDHFAGSTGGGSSLNGAFLYGTPDGTVTQLDWPRGRFLAANDINHRGDFVGYARISFGLDGFVVLYRNSRMWLLNDVIDDKSVVLSDPVAISENGYIAATGRRNGAVRAFLLIPRAPFAPQDLMFTSNNREVALEWKEAAGAIDYMLEVGSVSGSRDLLNVSVGPTRTLRAAAPPGRYFVRIRGRNEIGIGDASAEVVFDVR